MTKDNKSLKEKIIERILNTKLAAKLIDKHLNKRSIIEIANSINKDQQAREDNSSLAINNYIIYNKKNQGGFL